MRSSPPCGLQSASVSLLYLVPAASVSPPAASCFPLYSVHLGDLICLLQQARQADEAAAASATHYVARYLLLHQHSRVTGTAIAMPSAMQHHRNHHLAS
ncbi:hypothetical protein cyc_04269 [Cyclospora cayetanensis]|uniref:Uncharacterized protein n=1 Tax=Cyclospora cayetanensis TaxID=88456 RepID=A0A1D3D0R5_9EIME|nr:hypothetical protein cyc_04269 [Cyclospora cayetanensis]